MNYTPITEENVEKAEQELKLAEEEYNKKYETFSKKLVIMKRHISESVRW